MFNTSENKESQGDNKHDKGRAVPTGDCFEIALSGNDMSLFVRETSSLDCRGGGETCASDGDEPAGPAEPPGARGSSVSCVHEGGSHDDSPKFQQDEPLKVGDEQSASLELDKDCITKKQLRCLYNKKWSGKTYFEEELQRIRTKQYDKNVQDSLRKRRLWKKFQKEIARDRRRDLIRSSGPEWWQEPSRRQIELASRLRDVLRADEEEASTRGTRQWLLDLGVTTRPTPRQVRLCMRRALRDPVDFLLEMHALVVKFQLNVKKKKGDLERPFSINERLLLSAVCVLHLPTLLTILHYILPPPQPYSEPRHIQELLFGDLSDDRIRYSTPYMEPLPFRSKGHFQEWAFDKVFAALLPALIKKRGFRMSDESRNADISMSTVKLSVFSQKSMQKSAERRKSSDISPTPSVSWLISQCVDKRIITDSLMPVVDGESLVDRMFNRHLRKSLFLPKGNESHKPTQHGLMPTPTPSQSLQLTESDFPMSSSFSNGPSTNVSVLTAETATFQLGTNSLTDTTIQPLVNPTGSQNNTQRSLGKEGGMDSGKKFVPNTEDLEYLWEEMSTLTSEHQLSRAVQVLAGMGDPLAQLPRIHRLPTVQRWQELRRGRRRLLSQADKTELLRTSRALWKMAPVKLAADPPKIKMSNRQKRTLTWDKRKWLQTRVDKEVGDYFTRVKQEKVDNARAYFPTMLNHYDHGSKLNRNFRDTFFTYLPAREADTYVYRPW